MTTDPEVSEQPSITPEDIVSVVIVSYNRVNELRAGLAALHPSDDDPRLQVIVVDNGSDDGSATLDDEFPAAQFIRLPKNFGLTKALNLGIRASAGDHILFLHDDIEIQREAIERLRTEMLNRPEIGGVCPLLADDNGQRVLQLRDMPDPAHPDPPFRISQPGETPAVSCAAIMVRRLFLNAMRQIDERYGNYGSDIEICMQIKRANKKIVVLDGVTAIHRPEPQDRSSIMMADRHSGIATFLGKYYGFLAGFQYRVGSILGALFTFQLGRLRYLVAGQKIDGE